MRIFFCIVLLLSIALQHNAYTANDEKVPSERIFDFGVITEGENRDCGFSYMNNEKKPVKITDLRTTCGCTKGKFEKRAVSPGEKFEFSVKFISKGRRGKLKKNVYLVTDSEKEPVVKYIITGEIKAPHRKLNCLAQTKINAGTMSPEEKKNLEFEIKNNGASTELVINKGSSSGTVQFLSEFPLKIAPKKKSKIKLIYTAPSYPGKMKSNMMFRTNDPMKPNLWIEIIANVK
jgi:DNA repair exonuclease SbcCD nuclease subunit